MKHLEFL